MGETRLTHGWGSDGSPSHLMPVKRMLNTAEAAVYVGLAKSTLDKLRTLSSDGPPFCKLGRRIAYAVDDLDTWLMAHRRRSTAEAA